MVTQLNPDAINACENAATLYPRHPIILYGSHARGDFTSHSDVDVLIAGTSTFEHWNDGKVSYSLYPTMLLSQLSETGSLFSLHLKRDGVIFRDQDRRFEQVVESYNSPDSYLDLRCEMKTLLNVLDVDEIGYQETPEWLIRVALFLMRTAVFIESAESGKPSFSIPEISLENHDPALLRNYQLKYKRMVTFGEFCDVRSYVEKKLGTAALNPYKSVLQLIGNEASKSDLLRGFARKLLQFKDFLSSSGFVVDYAVEYQRW